MMAVSPAISTTFLPNRPISAFPTAQCQFRSRNYGRIDSLQKPISFTVRAAKLPPGVGFQTHSSLISILVAKWGRCFQVEVPKVEPKLSAPTLGFTRTAEIWNSRASMIGLIGIFIVELVSLSIQVHDFSYQFPSRNLGEIQTVLSSSPAVGIHWNASGHMREKGRLNVPQQFSFLTLVSLLLFHSCCRYFTREYFR